MKKRLTPARKILQRRRPITTGDRLARIEEHLHDLLRKVTTLVHQGKTIMATNAEVKRLLEEIDAVTNQMAANEAEQTAKTAEIGADLDSLIALVQQGNEPLSPETIALVDGIKAKVTAAAQFGAAQAAALTALAAKHDGSAPPVEPPPVV